VSSTPSAALRPRCSGPGTPPPLPASNGLLDTTERSAHLRGLELVGLLAGVIPVMHFFTIDALDVIASAPTLRLFPTLALVLAAAAAAAFSAFGGPMKDIPMAVLRQTRLDPPIAPPQCAPSWP